MRSVPFALTWELLYCGRWTLLLGLAGGMALPVILLTSLNIAMISRQVQPHRPVRVTDQHSSSNATQTTRNLEISTPGLADADLANQLALVQVVLIQLNIFILGISVVSALRGIKRLYAFPMSSTAIATSQLLLGMAVMAAESILGITMLNALFRLNWPLWGPALFAAVAFASVQSMIWQTSSPGLLVIGICAIASVLGAWLNARYSMFSPPCRPWEGITPIEVGTLLIFGAIAFYTAILGVARDRRGDQPQSLGIAAWFERLFDSRTAVVPDFKSRLAAQAWFDWRTKGWPMPATVMAGIVFGALIWLVNSRDPKLLLIGCFAGGFLFPTLSMVAALISGNLGSNDGNYDMGHFLATRPISNSELARSLLATAMKSLFFAWCMWLCALLFVWGTLVTTGMLSVETLTSYDAIHRWAVGDIRERPWIYIENGKAHFRWIVLPLTLLGPWIVVSFGMSVGSSGRIKTFIALFFSGLFLLVVGIQLSQFALSNADITIVAERCLTTGGVILALGSVIVLVRAHRRSLTSPTTTYASLVVWAALSSLTLVKWSTLQPVPLAYKIFAIGIAALVVVPFSAVPLGIAMNRTR